MFYIKILKPLHSILGSALDLDRQSLLIILAASVICAAALPAGCLLLKFDIMGSSIDSRALADGLFACSCRIIALAAIAVPISEYISAKH